MRVCLLANFKLGELMSRRPWVWAGVLGGQKGHAMPAGQVCECCIFAGNHQAESIMSRGPVGQIRGAGSRQGY